MYKMISDTYNQSIILYKITHAVRMPYSSRRIYPTHQPSYPCVEPVLTCSSLIGGQTTRCIALTDFKLQRKWGISSFNVHLLQSFVLHTTACLVGSVNELTLWFCAPWYCLPLLAIGLLISPMVTESRRLGYPLSITFLSSVVAPSYS